MRSAVSRIGLALVIGLLGLRATPARAAETTVCAVLFYSPTCTHCHDVITNTLLPMTEQYGDQLNLLGVDVSTEEGQNLWGMAIQAFNVPEDRHGVPMLFVDELVLVGSVEIPERFPMLVEGYLAKGGLACPAIPGLEATLPPTEAASATTTGANAPAASSSGAATLPTTQSTDVLATIGRDPVGNGLAIVVLIGLVAVAGAVVAQNRYRFFWTQAPGREQAILALSLVGLVVAGYLAYVESAEVSAICGPVGDCNTVQQSPYARLFGLLPVGWVGVLGYIGILGATWLGTREARLARFAMVAFGVAFSIYLTFLEPFVIGASCAWCLTSAVIMGILLWLTADPVDTPRRVRPARA